MAQKYHTFSNIHLTVLFYASGVVSPCGAQVENLSVGPLIKKKSQYMYKAHPENSFFKSKKHFFDTRSKKQFLESKKVLLIQNNFL